MSLAQTFGLVHCAKEKRMRRQLKKESLAELCGEIGK
jgi:hypothetical protein